MTAGTAVNPLEVARYVAARHRTNGDEAQQLAYIAAAAWRERYGHRHYRRPFSVACAAAFRETALALRRQAAVVDISEGVATGRVKGDVEGVFDRESLFQGDHHGQKTRDGYAEAAGGGGRAEIIRMARLAKSAPPRQKKLIELAIEMREAVLALKRTPAAPTRATQPPGVFGGVSLFNRTDDDRDGLEERFASDETGAFEIALRGERVRIARTARLLAELDDNAKKLIHVAMQQKGQQLRAVARRAKVDPISARSILQRFIRAVGEDPVVAHIRIMLGKPNRRRA